MATYGKYTLLSNESATGTAVQVLRGKYHFHIKGTFGGATATLQYSDDNSTWTTLSSSAVFTAAGNTGVMLTEGYVRVLIAGGSPSALYATLGGVE